MPFQGGIQTGGGQERAVLKCYKVYDDIGSRDSPAVLVFWNFIYNLVSDICIRRVIAKADRMISYHSFEVLARVYFGEEDDLYTLN